VNFIFQPAEEGLGGALAMLKDGLLERFPCNFVYGLHNSPAMPLGKFAIRKGPAMASGAFFDIMIRGRGAHGALPEMGIDPVLVACHVNTALQSIVSRNVPPAETAVVSVTVIQGGDAYNVIPDSAVLRGTVRTALRSTMELVEAAMKRIAPAVAGGFGATAEVDFRFIFAPLVNEAQATDDIVAAARAVVGEENVSTTNGFIMASEDFSFVMEKAPGAYINLGNVAPGEAGATGVQVHNPGYDFNDEAIPYGAAMFCELTQAKLPKDFA
jgi:hippurate hydrolase